MVIQEGILTINNLDVKSLHEAISFQDVNIHEMIDCAMNICYISTVDVINRVQVHTYMYCDLMTLCEKLMSMILISINNFKDKH